MKKNKNGFVLAEAIIVAVFVVGLFTYIAVNILPLISMYEVVEKYDNPNEIYAVNLLYDEFLELGTNIKYEKNKIYSFDINNDTGDMSCKVSSNSGYKECSTVDDSTFTNEYFKDLIINRLQISKLIIFDYSNSFDIPTVGSSNERSLKSYFNYKKDKSSFSNATYLIVQFKNNNFSYIKMN